MSTGGGSASGPASTSGTGAFQLAASLSASASSSQKTAVNGGPITGAVFNYGPPTTAMPSWYEIAALAVAGGVLAWFLLKHRKA